MIRIRVTEIITNSCVTTMDRQFSVLLILVFATSTMAGIVSRIIGGHDVKKRSINEALHFKVISTVYDYNPDFPQEKVEQILDVLERKNLTIFSNDVQKILYLNENEIPEYLNMCQFETKEFIPTVIEDANGKRHYVLNSKNRIMQRVQYEICLTSNKQEPNIYEECKYSHVKPNSAARCYQTYTQVPLYTVSYTEHKPSLEYFLMPSSCSCYVFSDLS